MKLTKVNCSLVFAFWGFLFLQGPLIAQTPGWDWADKVSGSDFEIISDMEVDDNGNMFATGSFKGALTTPSGPVSSMSSENDIFVAKYTNTGVLDWVITLGGNGEDLPRKLLYNDSGVLLLSLVFRSDSLVLGNTVLYKEQGEVAIVAFDVMGNVIWAINEAGNVAGTALNKVTAPIDNLTSNGNFIFMTGCFYADTVYFGNISLINPAPGDQQSFLAKFDMNGNLINAIRFGGIGDTEPLGITQDQSGNVIILGKFQGTLITPGTTLANLDAVPDIFFIKYSPNIQILDLNNICANNSLGEFMPKRVETSSDNGIVLAGELTGDVLINSLTPMSSAGGKDGALIKLDADSNLDWALEEGGTANDVFLGLSTTQWGSIVVSGYFESSSANYSGNFISVFGARDGIAASYDLNGNVNWVKPVSGTGAEEAAAIAQSDCGTYIGGNLFSGTVFLGAQFITYANGSSDNFLAMLEPSQSEPTVQSSALDVDSVTCSGINLSWVPGNGLEHMVIGRIGGPVNAFPVDGVTYSGDTVFGAGDHLGSGNYVLYTGPDSLLMLDNLFSNTSYHFAVVDLNLNCQNPNYLITSPSTASQITNDIVSATVAIQGNPVFCEGDSVILTGPVGAAGWQWLKENQPISGEVSMDLTVMESGNYMVEVLSPGGCRDTSGNVGVSVLSNPQPSITNSGSAVFCENQSVTLSVGAFNSYSWTPNGEASQSIVVEESGTYVVTVFAVNGCSSQDSIAIAVDSVPAISIDSSGSLAFCEGQTVEIIEGSIADTWQWLEEGNPVLGANSPGIEISESGNYAVIAAFNNGCSDTSGIFEVTVYESPQPEISVTGALQFCDGDSAVLDAGTYQQFNWNVNAQSTQQVSAFTSGVYSVWVTDDMGCMGVDSVVVDVYPQPVAIINISGDSVSCEGEIVNLEVGGFDLYLWSNGETSGEIQVLVSGNYEVTGTDTNGCVDQASIDITILDAPQPSISANGVSEFCEGGEVELTTGVYTNYVWLPSGDTTQNALITTGGAHFVSVTDTNGCIGVDSFEVNVFPSPDPNITADGPAQICEGTSLELSTGIFDSYNWWPNGEATQSIIVDESGNYIVAVSDTNGCVGQTSFEVGVFPDPEPVLVTLELAGLCSGGTVDLTAGEYESYLWSPSGETSSIITVDAPGIYTLEVTDSIGCTGQGSLSVVEFPSPEPVIIPDGPTVFCEGNSVSLSVGSFDHYLWLPDSTGSPSADAFSTGIMSVVVTDGNGCTGTDSVEIEVLPAPKPSFTYTTSGSLVSFTNTTQGENTFSWNFGDDLFSDEFSPTHEYDSSATFWVCMNAMNVNGCANVACDSIEVIMTSTEVKVNTGHIFAFPNPFSDQMFIQGQGVFTSELTVKLVDLHGKIVSQDVFYPQTSNWEIPLSMEKVSSGLYLLHVSGQDFLKVLKVTKN